MLVSATLTGMAEITWKRQELHTMQTIRTQRWQAALRRCKKVDTGVDKKFPGLYFAFVWCKFFHGSFQKG
jgi:hypothetical protein